MPEEKRQEFIKFEPAIARLEAQVGSIAEDMSEMRTALQQLTATMAKIAVIDERLANQGSALERAFTAIDKQKTDHSKFVEKQEGEHGSINRLVWTAGGIISVLSIISGGFTTYAVKVMNDISTSQQEVRVLTAKIEQHLKTDTLQNEHDLRAMLRDLQP